MHKLQRMPAWIKRQIKQKILKQEIEPEVEVAVLDEYVSQAPHLSQTLETFSGKWLSTLPESSDANIPLGPFNDERLLWMEEVLGSVQDFQVLQIAPQEAGQVFMLEQMGAKSILALEGNTQTYLKCLIGKAQLKLQHCQFLLGDFRKTLQGKQQTWDLCVAMDVLQCMHNPVEVLAEIAAQSESLFLWTQYYDAELLKQGAFSEPRIIAFNSQQYKLYPQKEPACQSGRFASQTASWMDKDTLLVLLKDMGYSEVRYQCHESHPEGPTMAIVASKKPFAGIDIAALAELDSHQLAVPDVQVSYQNNRVTIHWQLIDKAKAYYVFYADTPNLQPCQKVLLKRGTALSANLAPGQTYYVAVQAYSRQGISRLSPVVRCELS